MSTRPSRFRRSMTPSSSVKMTPSRFNLVCGKTRETAVTPNTPRSLPRSSYPSHNVVEYTSGSITPSYHAHIRDRSHSVTRDVRPSAPMPPTRDSSLYLPFGSYADLGIHTKPPSKYAAGVTSAYGSAYSRHIRQGSVVPESSVYSSANSRDARRRSITPGPSFPSSGQTHQASYQRQTSYQNERRSSSTFTSQSFRRPSISMSIGTPSGARGVCRY